jgi:integrase
MGECRGLLVHNAHPEEGYVDILTNFVAADSLKPPKWGSERLGVPIPDLTVRALQALLLLNLWGEEPDDFVFFSSEARTYPIDNKVIEKGLFGRIKEAGIAREGGSFHSFRHSYVSHLRGKLPEGKLIRFVGHTNLGTFDRYCHATDDDREAVRQVVAGLLPAQKAEGEE